MTELDAMWGPCGHCQPTRCSSSYVLKAASKTQGLEQVWVWLWFCISWQLCCATGLLAPGYFPEAQLQWCSKCFQGFRKITSCRDVLSQGMQVCACEKAKHSVGPAVETWHQYVGNMLQFRDMSGREIKASTYGSMLFCLFVSLT